jgi:Flp pilus assembly protein TadD
MYLLLTALLLLSTASLEEARRLAGDKRYDSAMKMLTGLEQNPQVIVEQIRVALEGYAMCLGGELFAFRDLAPGEAIEQVRGAAGDYQMYPLNLEKLQKVQPEDPELLTWLGHLAYFQAHDCGSKEATDAQARSLYERALQRGAQSPQVRRNLALIYLKEKELNKAVPLFRATAASYADDPQFQYNFGYALFMSKDGKEALAHVEKAFRLYKDKKLVSEAALLAAIISWDGKDKEKALKMAAEADGNKSQNYYYVYTKLFGLYGAMGEWSRAEDVADRLFELDPKNPHLTQDVLAGYAATKRPRDIDAFFIRQLEKQQSNPEAVGNLLYHRAQWNAQNGRRTEARTDFVQARESFAKVLPAEHKVFAAIEASLKDL